MRGDTNIDTVDTHIRTDREQNANLQIKRTCVPPLRKSPGKQDSKIRFATARVSNVAIK